MLRGRGLGTTAAVGVLAVLLTLSLAAGQAAADPSPPMRVVDSLSVGSVDLDPATAGFASLWTVEYATCVNLLNHPDGPHTVGAGLALEAASSMNVSADGKTYTFTVAPGFAFSPPSSEQVSADSFRVALERVAKLNSGVRNELFSKVVGIQDFASGATTSIAGVSVSGNQLTISLTAPDDALPADLATPYMCAVPVGTPLTHQTGPLPMAGPYYVDPATYSGAGDATFSLLKNPNYAGARPQTLPQFDFEFGVDPSTAVSRVTAASPTADLFLNVALDQRSGLYANYGQDSAADVAGHQQYFAFTSLGTRHLVMNTRSGGKLTNSSVRRAISMAIDRNTLASAFGDAPTDQYEPNGIAGFQDFNLFGFSPDVADAQALMQSAGFNASNRLALNLVVANNAPNSPTDNFAHAVQSELASIYIDVTITQVSGSLFSYIPAHPNDYDLTLLGWNTDNGDPENMLAPLLEGGSSPTPGADNWSQFDDPNVNARFAYERGLTGSARLAELANMDADLAANYAPMAAFSNLLRAAITSERLGCFVAHAIYAVSLPRLCERGAVAAGGTYSSGSEPTASEPVAAIQTPTGGDVTVSPGPRSTDTSGYRLLDGELSIEAPSATASDPIRITFQLDAAAMAAAGVSYTDVAVLRNGAPVPPCTTTDGTATPDPCVASRTLDTDGDATFVVLTSHASTWAFGAPDSTPPVLNSASLSAAAFVVGGTTTLSASAASDASAGELFVDTDAGPGHNSALNGGAGTFSSPPFGQTLAVGTHTVGVRVRDEAGNWSAPILLTLTVQPVPVFSGFFAPIQNPPAENATKAGSAVNLGFSLGSNYGTNPLDDGYPKVRSYVCGTTPSGTYSSVPQSAVKLKYDRDTVSYKLTWQTPKNSSGCQELLLRFPAGLERTVRFRFR